MLNKISLVMVVYNEQDRLKQMLPMYSGKFAEIVVVDQSSTDDTKGVVERAGARYHNTLHWGFSEPSKNLAAFLIESEWCLYLDADEELSDSFFRYAKNLTYSSDCYYLLRENMVGDSYDDRREESKLRLFRRGMAYCEPILHTDYKPHRKARVDTIPNISIFHYKNDYEWRSDHDRYKRLTKMYCGTPIIKPHVQKIYGQ